MEYPKNTKEIVAELISAGMRGETVIESRQTVKDLINQLQQLPEDMLVGLKNEDDNTITSQINFIKSQAHLTYDGFDGHNSYTGVSKKPITFVTIDFNDIPYHRFDMLRVKN